ncbi:MAG TPA: hypothetical protein VMG98_04015 [Verrucomicrobiae bacterium]|nr:hypothetical protein [Verrucomicrobiae bacterium]
MKSALEMARAYGVAVEYADLGDWGRAELRSEYDPQGPVIRINSRCTARLDGTERDDFVARCIFHELYHHREAVGDVRRQQSRRAREDAADAYARAMLALR